MSNKTRPSQYADQKGTILEGFRVGLMAFGQQSSLPANAQAGYEPGALLIVTDGAAGACLYKNEGTKTSSLWVPISTGGINLSTLVATAAELNRSSQLSSREVAAGAATLTVTLAAHSDRTILLDQATGVAVTLPAMTGSGAKYRFVCSVATSGGSHVITATAAHLFGSIFMGTDTTAATLFTAVTAENVGGSTVITLDGSTKGGKKGDWFEIEDVAAGIGLVRGHLNASGTEATPFA